MRFRMGFANVSYCSERSSNGTRMCENHGRFDDRFNVNFLPDSGVDRAGRVSYAPFMALLRTLFWIALFLLFTFSFIVFFEYGTHDFVPGFQKEFERVKTFVLSQTSKTPPAKK
jgi:hypothetical protein